MTTFRIIKTAPRDQSASISTRCGPYTHLEVDTRVRNITATSLELRVIGNGVDVASCGAGGDGSSHGVRSGGSASAGGRL